MTDKPKIVVACSDERLCPSICELLRRDGGVCERICSAKHLPGTDRASEPCILLLEAALIPDSLEQLDRGWVDAYCKWPTVIIGCQQRQSLPAWAFRLHIVSHLQWPLDSGMLLGAVRKARAVCRTIARIDQSDDELGQWRKELHVLREWGDADADSTEALSLTTYVRVSMRNIFSALFGVLDIVDAACAGSTHTCELMQCPRLHALETTVREAVDVLEGTKRHFKSQELGALRAKLETLIP